MKLQIASNTAKKVFEISPIVDGEITWTTERSGAAGTLEFTVLKKGQISYLEGDEVTFQVDPHPLVQNAVSVVDMFKGYVFKKVKSQESIKTTAYDQFVYLNQCKQSYNFKGEKLKGIIEKIAKEFGLKFGKLADPQYILPDCLYEDKTLFSIITECVTRTNIATGKVYVFYDNFGELMLTEATDMKSKLLIGNQSFATDYTYTTSLENTYNFIKLVQPNKASGGTDAYVVEDMQSMKDWGKLQYYEKVDENLNPAQIQEKARTLFNYYDQRRRTLKISAIGVPDVRAGSMVMLDIPALGDIDLKKLLLINKCTHRITSNSHTMDLEMEVYNG